MTSVTFPVAVGGDGSTVTDDSSTTTGLANGGFRTRLLPALTNTINIAQNTVTQATNAATSATNAASSAATAASAPGTNATSTTSLTVGTGSQTLTIQTGKSLVVGAFVTVASTASPTTWMYGNITAYNSGTGALTINVTTSSGAGTYAAWTLSLAGAPGQAAGVTSVSAQVTTSTNITGVYTYVPVQMSGYGRAVSLPAANTLTVGGPQYIIDNSKGGYAAGVRDSAGTLLMGVAPGGIAYVALRDNTTAAGVWSIDGTNLEPGLISIDSTLSAYTAVTNDTATGVFVAINSNQSIHFTRGAGGANTYAFIVDNTGKQVTTPTLLVAAAVPVVAAWAVTASTFIVFYTASNATYAVILSVSGTVITVGTSVNVASTALQQNDTGFGAPQIVQLSATTYATAGYQSTALAGYIFTVSGTTVTTSGATVSVSNLSSTATQVYALTSTTALVIFATGTPSAPYTTWAAILQNVGGTAILNTSASLGLTGGKSGSANPLSSCLLSPTTALVVTDNNTGLGGGYWLSVCTISGTTVTWGTPTQFDVSGSWSFLNSTNYTNGANRYAPALLKLSGTTALVSVRDAATNSHSAIATVSGSTVTEGATVYNAISGTSGNADNTAGVGVFLPITGTTEMLVIKQRIPVVGGGWLYAQPSKISGTTITMGNAKNLLQLGPNAPIYQGSMWCNKLSSGDYVIGGTPASSPAAGGSPELVVMRSNGDAINFRGTISMPAIVIAPGVSYQNGNVAPNRVVLIGGDSNGSTTGTVIATYAQTRILSVEIAA